MARPTLTNHPKFHRLAATVGSSVLARGILETLWDIAYEAGDPVIGSADDVEALAQWTGKQGELAAALWARGRGFFDVIDTDSGPALYAVHDLEDHAPDYVLKRWQREEERRQKGQTIRSIRQEAARRAWEARYVDANVRHLQDSVKHASTTVEPPSRAPSPSPKDLGVAPACAIPEAPYQPPREARRPLDAFGAHNSQAFCRVFDAYPRKDARLKAAVAFQVVAETYDGGEDALATAMLAAFPAMLARAPYNGPNARRPFLETVIVERRWEDPPSAPDPTTRASPAYRDQPPSKPQTYVSLNRRG